MTLDRAALTSFRAFLNDTSRILITSHMRPDPDAIGSALAASEIVSHFGGAADVVLEDACPRRCLGLPGAERIRTAREWGSVDKFARAIIVDSGSRNRIGEVERLVAGDALVVNLDHHISNTKFGTINLVDTGASASGELLFHIAREFQVPLTISLATNLLAGILTDTGRFRHANTSPGALQTAAALVAAGASLGALTEQLYYRIPERDLRATARILTTLTLHEGGRVSTMLVSLADAVEDPDNIVDLGRSIEGVEVAVLFSEMADGRIRVSLRSNSSVNVSALAESFGGGGHERAAGFRMTGTLESVRARLLPRLAAALAELAVSGG